MKRRMGVVIEILSDKQCLGRVGSNGKDVRLSLLQGHITHCITLHRGWVFEDTDGLKFQIDLRRGCDLDNTIQFSWDKVLEVRTLKGRVLFKNAYLCSNCRRISMHKTRCYFCGHLLSGIRKGAGVYGPIV